MKDIGNAILEEIIKEDLVHADSTGVCVWKANAAEILEAIASRYSSELFHERLMGEAQKFLNEGSGSQE